MIVKGIFIEDQLKPTRRPFCMAFGVSGKPRKIHLTIYYFLFLIAVNIGTPIRIRVVEQTSFYLEFAC